MPTHVTRRCGTDLIGARQDRVGSTHSLLRCGADLIGPPDDRVGWPTRYRVAVLTSSPLVWNVPSLDNAGLE